MSGSEASFFLLVIAVLIGTAGAIATVDRTPIGRKLLWAAAVFALPSMCRLWTAAVFS